MTDCAVFNVKYDTRILTNIRWGFCLMKWSCFNRIGTCNEGKADSNVLSAGRNGTYGKHVTLL